MQKDLKIGLALSGGGVRAAVFHIGVMKRLAEDELMEQVTFVSTVSGGTLVTGLVFAKANYQWPTSDVFLSACLPQIRNALMEKSLQGNSILRWIFSISSGSIFQLRANVLTRTIRKHWGISGNVNDLPQIPRWVINSTAMESGKSWRFLPDRMGDYILKYSDDPIPLAHAMAASAAYPLLVGPLHVSTKHYKWFEYKSKAKVAFQPRQKKIHLWDGGVYDNLGVEPLFKIGGEFRPELNFLVVSDASAEIMEKRVGFHSRARRLLEIAMDQIRSLRSRTIVQHFLKHPSSGIYLKIGNAADYILRQAGFSSDEIQNLIQTAMSVGDTKRVADFGTNLKRLTGDEFDMICRHGWEVANYTLQSRCPDLFSHRVWEE